MKSDDHNAISMVAIADRHSRLQENVERAVLSVLRSGRHIGGPVVDVCEKEIAEIFGFRYAVGLNSGTDALIMGLQALGLGAGARVAVPAVSFFATTEAVMAVGAEPVFVDLLDNQPLIDPSLIPAGVDAIIPVQLFGAKAPDCTGHGVPVLSDSAQCAGWGHGRPQGVGAALSFYPTKSLGGAGDGGAFLTDDENLIKRVRRLGWHGQTGPHIHESTQGGIGRNSRLDPIQAAIILEHAKDLDRRVERRRGIAKRYEEALSGRFGLIPRSDQDAVHQFVILCGEPAKNSRGLGINMKLRGEVVEALNEANIASAVYYPYPMDTQPIITGRQPSLDESNCPNGANFCSQALAIPCHAEMSDYDIDRILDLLTSLRSE
jgi:dTDP-4-amino-4,6-dideoxygalactose transaminase